MNISAPFVRRPVATTLIALGILLVGIVSYARLPIASLPTVDRPTIVVNGYLPGASAETIASTLAQPLERQLGTIPGIAEMASFSGPGGTWITIQFNLDQDIDAAAGAVQAAINAASPNLPKDLPRPPIYWKANPAGVAVMALALTSDVLPASEVYDYSDSVVAQRISQLPGVAKVFITGADRGAVRIQAKPRLLANMGLSLDQVRIAVAAASQNLPKGTVTVGEQSYALDANDQLKNAADYGEVVVAYRNGAPVRLADVAGVSDGVINSKLAGWFGEQRAVIVYVYKQIDANVVETVDQIKQLLPELNRWIPPAIKVTPLYDRTTLIRASIADVKATIAIAVVLVVIVLALFLKRASTTAIPALTIPVVLGITLVLMDFAGYSLDNISLMAIVIAIGFIVDDAVIVVENFVRLTDEGNGALEAALKSARQMGFTIVAITAALIAALLPVLFMPDIIGRYFREFGVTVAAAIAASALVSLTLTPMLCSRLVRSEATRPRRPPGVLARAYARSLSWNLRHPALLLVSVVLLAAGTVGLYVKLPKGFMPTQDTGLVYVRTITSANVSFAAMEDLQRTVARTVLDDPAVEGLSSYIGTDNGSTLSSGSIIVSLKPMEQRGLTLKRVIERLRRGLGKVEGVRAFVTPIQDLSVGAQSSAARYQYTLSAADPDEVFRWADVMRRRMQAMPELAEVITDAEITGLESGLSIDRARAAAMGVTPFAIDNALYNAFGQRQIKTIYLPSNYSRVVLEVEPATKADPSTLGQIYVPALGGGQVPLAAITRPTRQHAAMWMRHSDQFPSVTVSFDMKPGVSLGEAIGAIRAQEAAAGIPDDVKAAFRGEAGEAAKSGGKQLALILGAIFAIYVVLGVLYESYAHPFTILSTLPSAGFGALLALTLTGIEFTLMTLIASILLIGMVMKNAIMMIDFAIAAQRHEGMPPHEAIAYAARLRARPIIMTTLVAIFTAVPLAVGLGQGHELRQPLGVAIVGGLLVSQLITLYTTPVVYLMVERIRTRRSFTRAGP